MKNIKQTKQLLSSSENTYTHTQSQIDITLHHTHGTLKITHNRILKFFFLFFVQLEFFDNCSINISKISKKTCRFSQISTYIDNSFPSIFSVRSVIFLVDLHHLYYLLLSSTKQDCIWDKLALQRLSQGSQLHRIPHQDSKRSRTLRTRAQ